MSSAVCFTSRTSTDDELVKFGDLPVWAEMKDHIFKHLSARDLVISRGICHNWNFIITDSKRFQESITFTVCNDETLRIFRKSYTNWIGMKVTSFYSNSNLGPHQDILPQFINELEYRYSNLSKLLLHDLHIQQSTFLRVIVACPNLKSLVLDHVHIMTNNIQVQSSDSMFPPEILIKARRVAENLIILKLNDIQIQEMLFLYNCFALHTLILTEFYVQECKCQYLLIPELQSVEETLPQIQTFLDNTKRILLNNSSSLKTIDFSLNHPAAMFKFYSQILAALTTLDDLQLHNLYLHLYRPTDIFLYDSYFWLDWATFFGEEDDGTYIPPTQLFTMWKDFIATQRNLRTLYLPHIELSQSPFDETHNHALFELLTSLPTSIKELSASLVQKGINERDVLVYQNLTILTTSVNLLEHNLLVETNDPTFMFVENMVGRPNPKASNLEDLTVNFLSGRDIIEKTGIRICKVLLKICPIYLKRLVIKGSLLIGDGGLQIIIECLPLLEVMDWCCKILQTDHGVTGISKSWLMNAVENISEFSNLINSEKKDGQPDIVGLPISKLKYLEVLKLPNLVKLSDIGIYYGLRLPRLKKLCLSQDQPYDKVCHDVITDWGLQQLGINCPALETIRIGLGELTTVEGVQNFIGSMKRIKQSTSILKRVVRSEHTVQ